jgi:hypothetical protein
MQEILEKQIGNGWDFVHATNYWPVLFCDAWWLAKENGQI